MTEKDLAFSLGCAMGSLARFINDNEMRLSNTQILELIQINTYLKHCAKYFDEGMKTFDEPRDERVEGMGRDLDA